VCRAHRSVQRDGGLGYVPARLRFELGAALLFVWTSFDGHRCPM